MLRKNKKYSRRALRDTAEFFGWKWRSLVFPFLFFSGAYMHYSTSGETAVLSELQIYALYTLAPIGAFTLLLFLWNLACAPMRTERDMRLAAEDETRAYKAALRTTGTVKDQIRTILEQINPMFLPKIDSGQREFYTKLREPNMVDFKNRADTNVGRKYIESYRSHGVEISGHGNLMRDDIDPIEDINPGSGFEHITFFVTGLLLGCQTNEKQAND